MLWTASAKSKSIMEWLVIWIDFYHRARSNHEWRLSLSECGVLSQSTDFILLDASDVLRRSALFDALPESRSLVLRIVQVFWLHTEQRFLCQFKIATP